MPRKSVDPDLDSLVDAAAAAPDSAQRKRIAARATGKVLPGKKKTGRPSAYTEKIGSEICRRLSEGQVLTVIARELNISLPSVYRWIEDESNGFREKYRAARACMAETLIYNLISETESIGKDEALAKKVRAGVITWFAARANPENYSDSKRIQLSAEVNHRHTHELTVDQKRRIAESWLMTQQDTPLITAETSGPDIEPGVETVGEEARELPKRKAPAQKKKQADDDGW